MALITMTMIMIPEMMMMMINDDVVKTVVMSINAQATKKKKIIRL